MRCAAVDLVIRVWYVAVLFGSRLVLQLYGFFCGVGDVFPGADEQLFHIMKMFGFTSRNAL